MLKKACAKINQASVSEILLYLLVFFLPFQARHHHFFKPLSQKTFQTALLPEAFVQTRLDFHLTDFLMLALLLLAPPLLFSKGRKWFSLLLAASLVSILTSASRFDLWPYWRLFQFALPCLVAFSLFSFENGKKILRVICWIFLATALIECGVGIAQYAMQEHVGLKAFGEPALTPYQAPQISAEGGRHWIFGESLGRKEVLRAQGTFAHPNVFGAFLGLTLLATSFLFLEKRGRARLFLGSAIVLEVFTLLLTFSRGALYGSIGGALLLIAFFFSRKGWLLLIPYLLGGIFSVCILLPAFALKDTSSGAVSSRFYFQKLALEVAKERPLLGSGWGRYLIEVEHARSLEPNREVLTVHNIYLLLLAETGVLGLGAFLLGLGALLLCALRKRKESEVKLLVAMLLFLLLFGCVDHFLILRQHGRMMLFLIIGLLGNAIEMQGSRGRVPLPFSH